MPTPLRSLGLATSIVLGTLPAVTVAAEVTVFCSSSGVELQLCREGTSSWAEKTGNTVNVVTLPAGWDDVLPLYQQLLASKSTDVDVLILDTIWPGALKDHLVDMKEYVSNEELGQHFKAAVDGTTVNGKVLSIPWYMDTGLLFYRKDLLEKYEQPIPTTYVELTQSAEMIQAAERKQGNDDFWGYVWQGRPYEGLTCNIAEWFGSTRNGSIVSDKGAITVNSPDNVEVLKVASSWVNNISPPGVLNYDEESSRGVFQNGNALFMRNWAYAWNLANSDSSVIKDKVGVVSLPKATPDGKNAGCYGTALLGVSKYSSNPEIAVDLVQYLTGPEEQKRRAIEGGYSPTLPALYQDKEIIAANPFLSHVEQAFENVVARPSQIAGDQYSRVSYTIWSDVHAALAGNTDPQAALTKLERELERVKRRARW